MATKCKLPPGLTWRKNTIWIETSVDAEKIRKSCRTDDLREARRLLDIVKGQQILMRDPGECLVKPTLSGALFFWFDARWEQLAGQARRL